MKDLLVRTAGGVEMWDAPPSSSPFRFRKLDFALFIILVFLLTTTTFVFHAWSRLYALRAGYEIYQQDDIRRELMEENRRLHLEVAALKSPARIGRIARERLGLASPRADQIVTINVQRLKALARME